MTEQFFQYIVVWTILISSIAQAVLHFITAWALAPQPKEDRIGTTLRQRELSLGIKGVARSLFDLLLVVLVAWGSLPFTPLLREVIYVALTMAATIAILLGIRFIRALQRENWGRPIEARDERDIRQDARAKKLDARGRLQDIRGHRQDVRDKHPRTRT